MLLLLTVSHSTMKVSKPSFEVKIKKIKIIIIKYIKKKKKVFNITAKLQEG